MSGDDSAHHINRKVRGIRKMKYILYMTNKTTNHTDRLGEYDTLPEVAKDRDIYASNARYNNYTFRIKGVMV